MRKLLPLLVLSVLAAPAARADGSIAINLRAGVVKPWGDFQKSRPVSDVENWAFPFQGDLQFRFTRRLQAGAYGRYAPVTLADRTKNLCDLATPKASCGLSDLGFGGVVEYRFSDKLEGGGWVGASFGYEILKYDTAVSGVKTTRTLTGLEGGVQTGIDFELGGLTVGPFLQVGAGQYSNMKTETAATSTTAATSASASVSGQKLHGYAGLGIRLSLLL